MPQASPTSALANKSDTAFGNAIHFGDDCLSMSNLSRLSPKENNFTHLFARKLAVTCVIAAIFSGACYMFVAVLCYAVLHILNLRPNPQMIWAATFWIVACVAYKKTLVEWSIMKNEAGYGKSHLPIVCAFPRNHRSVLLAFVKPASVAFYYFFGKATCKSWAATNRIQKFWRDVFRVQSPFNKFFLSHA